MVCRLRLASLAVLAFTAPLLSACGDNSAPQASLDVVGGANDPFEKGIRLSLGGQMVRAATGEGLVGFDAEGRVVPALADRWIVTDDGLSYIFRLRDGTWPDRTALTGDNARAALRDTFAALKGTSLDRDLAAIKEIRAMAGRVIEIRLSRPLPELLDLLAQPELTLYRKGRSPGPMALHRDRNTAILTPVSPEKRGLAADPDWQEDARTIHLRAMKGEAAILRFQNRATDAVIGGRFEDFPSAIVATGLTQRTLRMDEVSGLFGLVVTNNKGWLDHPELREALAMAIDRDALSRDLNVRGWVATTRVIPATALDAPVSIGERWTGTDMVRRRNGAVSRIQRFKGQNTDGRKSLELRIALPVGPGADVLFDRLAADFMAIGIVPSRVGPQAAADLRLVDSVARYNRADWYFNQLACGTAQALCSAPADRRIDAANAVADPAERAELLADAEVRLTQANVYIPLGTPVRWSLVREPLPGFSPNARGWHSLAAIASPPK